MDFLEQLREKINKDNWSKILEEQEELKRKNKNINKTDKEGEKGKEKHDSTD